MRVCPRENVEARIQELRDRAEEVRADAVKIRQERIRASVLSIASSHDRVADSLARVLAKKRLEQLRRRIGRLGREKATSLDILPGRPHRQLCPERCSRGVRQNSGHQPGAAVM